MAPLMVHFYCQFVIMTQFVWSNWHADWR